jgi:hypothetical protein
MVSTFIFGINKCMQKDLEVRKRRGHTFFE